MSRLDLKSVKYRATSKWSKRCKAFSVTSQQGAQLKSIKSLSAGGSSDICWFRSCSSGFGPILFSMMACFLIWWYRREKLFGRKFVPKLEFTLRRKFVNFLGQFNRWELVDLKLLIVSVFYNFGWKFDFCGIISSCSSFSKIRSVL